MVQGMVLGLIVAAAGFWAMRRGLQDSRKNNEVEDIRARWELQKAIGNIHENSFDMVKQLERANELTEQMIMALNRLADHRWNSNQ